MNKKFEISGWSFIAYGVLFSITSILALLMLSKFDDSFPHIGIFHAFFVFGVAINILTVFCGAGLLMGKEYVHKIALPVSIFLLLNVPVGTVVGGIYLWQKLQKN